jgi:hypothetical protein
MMKTLKSEMLRKKIAAIIVGIMLISVFANYWTMVVVAAPVTPFAVKIPSGISGDNINAVLTNTVDSSDTRTVKISGGSATFTDFVDNANTYSLSITGMIGYKDYALSTMPLENGEYTVLQGDLEALPKYTISGTLVDENNNSYKSTASVSYTGYQTGTVPLKDGYFSFEIYGGKDYAMSISAADVQYGEIDLGTVNVTADRNFGEQKLAIQSFLIQTTTGANGSISPENESVLYNQDQTISITANANYRIASLTVDGGTVTGAVGLTTYLQHFNDVTDEHSVSATFASNTGDDNYATYTVTLPDGLNYENAQVTMKDKNNALIARTQSVTNDNEVVFYDFVDPDETYTITIAGVFGYKDYSINSVYPEYSNEISININQFVQLKTFTVSGTLCNESWSPYSGTAQVAFEGYTSGTQTLNNGYFSFTVYEGQNYKITFAASDNKYEKIIYENQKFTSNYNYGYFRLTVKTFAITTFSGANGMVVATPGTVNYNGTSAVAITANDYYQIAKLTVDGVVISEAAGEKEYTKTFNNIQSAHTVSATFVLEQHKITVVVGENGAVTWDPDNIFSKESGYVVVNAGTDPSFTAIANENWHIVEITDTKDNVTTTVDITPAWNAPKQYTHSLYDLDKDHTIVVNFEIDQCKVKITTNTMNTSGIVESSDEETKTCDYGTTYTVSSQPSIGCYFSAATIQYFGQAAEPLLLNDTGESYEATFPVDKDVEIVIVYQEGEPLPGAATQYFDLLKDDTYLIRMETVNGIPTYVFRDGGWVIIAPKSPYVRIAINNTRAGNIIFNESTNIFSSMMVTEQEHMPNQHATWYSIPLYPIQIIIDKDSPVVSDITTPQWSASASVISGTVSDTEPSSGLSSVVWSTSPLDEVSVLSETVNKVNISSTGGYSFTITGEQNQTYYVYAIDAADNVSAQKTVQVRIDQTPPTITVFSISGTQDPQNIKIFPFGTYSNQPVVLKITGSDSGVVSAGMKTITLYIDGVPFGAPATVISGEASFNIPSGIIPELSSSSMLISAVATDNVGNTTAIPVSPLDISGSLPSDQLTLENIKPSAVIEPSASEYTDVSGKVWYSDNATLTINVADTNSGIHSVTITVNGNEIDTDQNGKDINTNYGTLTLSDVYSVVTDPALRDPDDGSFTIVVTVEDNAGNIFETEKVIYQDNGVPYVEGFYFTPAEKDGLDGAVASVEATEYGYFFSEDTTVTVYTGDSQPSCGIQSITYFTVDVNGGKSAESSMTTIDDAITFEIPANFKGKIFAKATDNVGNTPEAFASPSGTIVEPPDKHLEEAHITFDRAQTTLRDVNGLDLYSGDTDVLLTVNDAYSGLYKVEWSVIAPYDTGNNQSGVIEIDNEASFAGNGEASGWTITKTDENLATQMSKTLKINNNSNAILIQVRITDRAGNVSEETISFSIDKTVPTIQVAYDNNSPDGQFSSYYSSDRTATIIVTERNFSPENVAIVISSTGKGIPAVSSWTTSSNLSNPDLTTHTATIRYEEDGEYAFDISFKDLAGNLANAFPRQTFTIDKTPPTVAVSYDNNEVLNGNYYKAWRTATITIVDRNFEAGRIKIDGVATDGGATQSFPATSGWSSYGDTHTATIHFSSDATYRFAITGQDRAGNSMSEFKQGSFVVDTKAPLISIAGVENRSANNGVVMPIISFSDINYDSQNVTILLSGSNVGSVTPNGDMSEQSNGEVFTFEDFDYQKDVDDIYTLEISVVDFAGNTSSQEIVFSVNRFGSVYTFADTLKSIKGIYVRDEMDVTLTETNVDTLIQETRKLKITINGVPKDLVEDIDYTVQFSGGDGEWSQYTYTINKDLFAGDGLYSVMLYSVDRAGNINENINEVKEAEISFGIDKTLPVIVSVDLESDKQYPVEVKSASFSIKDNLELKSVSVYLNGQKIEPLLDGENYTFAIPSSNTTQSVKVIAIDAAGNEHVIEINNILVTTNLFYRWYNNTTLFVGSLLGTGVLAVGTVLLIIFFRRKRGGVR